MKQAHSTTSLPEILKARIGILQSKWYREYTDKMVKKCSALLLEARASEPEIHIVPGSLELPIAAKTLASRKGRAFDALICFGAIIKGETYHFELVTNECSRGLGTVALEEDIPILVEVLPCTTLDQLVKRSGDDEFNKGIEAAIAAAEIVSWRREQGIWRSGK